MPHRLSLGTLCVQAGYDAGKGKPRQNPTNDHVAARIAALEGGVAAMLTSSGRAANFFASFNICETGGHIVSDTSIYGGTFNLLGTTFKKMGIEVTFVNQDAPEEEITKAFRPDTKLVFGETLSNPGAKVLDIEKFSRLAHSHGVPLIVDNTFPTPINCSPFEWGADMVTHSTTKYRDWQGVHVGGAVIDSGNFNLDAQADRFPGLTTPDESYHGLTSSKKFGKLAYITKATTTLMRDLGSKQSPQNAFYLGLGLQTLHVRMPRHCSSAEHAKQQKYMPNGSCGVAQDLVRLSIGLEDPEDIIADIRQSIDESLKS